MNAGRPSRNPSLFRSRLLTLGGGLFVGVALAGCGGSSSEPADPEPQDSASEAPTREVVVYTDADESTARAVVDAFELRSGVSVILVREDGPTAAADLSRRVARESDAPQADVWWSDDPYQTVELSASGALAPFTAAGAEQDFGGAWPTTLRAADETWYGFGHRARVIAYDTRKADAADVPRTLRDLAEPEWTGRVGLARPSEGTTAGHLAALVHLWGSGPTASWLTAMEANGLRLYQSGDDVVRAITDGEITLGLADSDDVWRAIARGMPIGFVYEASEIEPGFGAAPETVPPLMSFGPLAVPSTVGLVRNGPNETDAGAFIEFLLSAQCERLLMTGESRRMPVRLDLKDELGSDEPAALIPDPAEPDPDAVAASLDEARSITKEVLGL